MSHLPRKGLGQLLGAAVALAAAAVAVVGVLSGCVAVIG